MEVIDIEIDEARVSALRVQDMTFDAHPHEPEVLSGASARKRENGFQSRHSRRAPGALASLVMTRSVDPGRRMVDRLPQLSEVRPRISISPAAFSIRSK